MAVIPGVLLKSLCLFLRAGLQPGKAVLADQLMQIVAVRAAAVTQEGLAHQGGKHRQACAGHDLRGLPGETTLEKRQPHQGRALLLDEQIPGMLEDRPDRPVPGRNIEKVGFQQVQALLQLTGDLSR